MKLRSAARGMLLVVGPPLAVLALLAADRVPDEVQQPGTQPGEVGAFATNCDNCHGGTPNPELEPSFGWHGSMMSHSARDPLFWATLAVAEQDFLPGPDPQQRGGAGDLCLRCHAPGGWLGGRSTPTDGSALAGDDERGVECEFCHLLVNPDPPANVPGTVEEQNPPFEAYDPDTGEPYFGSAESVLNSEGTRLGPYDDAVARHPWLPSPFHRQGDFCGTCHDVSNPAVGDLAHNHGAQVPLDPGTYSGVLGSPVEQKAAFNNPPYKFGIVERTYSEWKASLWDTYLVNDYPDLPEDLRRPGGALDVAYHRAFDARADANYEDGTPRYYTCQTCHMAAGTGVGCNKQNSPTRTDLPRHDLTGGGYWVPDLVAYQHDRGTLRFGTLTQAQRDAMAAGKLRAAEMLRSAASLEARQESRQLVVRVTNLTGHKLITGYPEGRRMWLNVRWYDAQNALLAEDGAYGPIGRTVADLGGNTHQVYSLLDPEHTVLYEAEGGMDQGWASQLLSLGYDPNLPLAYDRRTDAVTWTLGQLASQPPGTAGPTFHFVLNNVLLHDTRIPPYGFAYDEARRRNTLPVPGTLYGDPGPGEIYRHWDEVTLAIPAGAARAEVRLYYQQTSWEYIQFLWLQNDGLNPFLGNEGVNLLDAWLQTGQSPPFEMALATIALAPVAGVPGEASRGQAPQEQLQVSAYDKLTGDITIRYTPACDATDHTIYYGPLDQVSSYAYSGAACQVGTTGSAAFNPGPGSFFFVIVGHNGTAEGSYGRDSAGAERPEDTGTPACDLPQDLTGVVCE